MSELLRVFTTPASSPYDNNLEVAKEYNANISSPGCPQTLSNKINGNNRIIGKHLPTSKHMSFDQPEESLSKLTPDAQYLEMPTDLKENATMNPSSLTSEYQMATDDLTPQNRSKGLI